MKTLETAKKMFDPFTGQKAKRLPLKQKMGGSVTRNGINVDKEIEEQTAKKYRSQKGRESLNPAQKNRNDSEGQKSYKQEDT